MNTGSKTNRIFVIDIARFYAIALVFYGHFIEELMLLKNPAAAESVQIYLLLSYGAVHCHSGICCQRKPCRMELRQVFKAPVFNATFTFYLLHSIDDDTADFLERKIFRFVLPSIVGYSTGLINTVFGLPSFCIPSWFLLLIIGVELVQLWGFSLS